MSRDDDLPQRRTVHSREEIWGGRKVLLGLIIIGIIFGWLLEHHQ